MDNEIEFNSDDELLSAYLDGELSAEREAELERRLEAIPALALKLERLSEANAALRDAYAPVAEEPMPQRVLDAIRRKPGTVRLPLAVAASVTLAIGVMLGLLIAPQNDTPLTGLLTGNGDVARGSGLHDTLETWPSGNARAIGADLMATPVLSFESREGGYCREIEIAGADVSAAALACRSDGGWRVEALGILAVPAQGGGQPGGEFRPAGQASSAIDAAIDERILGDPLDAAAEAELIESAWAPR